MFKEWSWLNFWKERWSVRRSRSEPLQSVAHFRRLLEISPSEPMTVASIPPDLRRRLQEEAIRSAFGRLEMPLRFLLTATTPGREPQSVDMCHEILRLWRQGLEREIRLEPGDAAGALRRYEPAIDLEYNVHGRCRPGDSLRVLIPCWRLNGQIVVRGEAEPVAGLCSSVAPSPISVGQVTSRV
jgi:hypothetical protein